MIKFTDNLTSKLFSANVVQRIVSAADQIAERNLSQFSRLFIAYSVLGYVLIVGFLGTILLLPTLWFYGFEDLNGSAELAKVIESNSGYDARLVRHRSLRPSAKPDAAPLRDQDDRRQKIAAQLERFSRENRASERRIRTLQYTLQFLGIGLVMSLTVIMRRYAGRVSSGLLLHRSEAPQLFDSVDRIAGSVNTVVDKIYVNEGFNCAVVTLPQLIGEKRYLYLGYPALACMSMAQLEAILTHEVGHLSLKHSRVQTLAQQQRLSWHSMLARWRRSRPYFYIPFNCLFFWYMPIFSALSFVLAKHHEFAADDIARKITQENVYSTSLISFVVKSNLFQRAFADQLASNSCDTESGGEGLFARSVAACLNATEADIDDAWQSFRRKHDEDLNSTHPCLMRRLQRLGLIARDQVESWRPNFDEILDNEGPKAIELLGRFAPQIEAKMSHAFSGEKMSHNVSRQQSHLVRGNAHYKAKRMNEALADFDEAIKLNPSSSEAYVSRSSVYIERKQFDKAIEDCDRAIALKPGYAAAFSNRACAHLSLSQWDDAIKDATVAISTDPQHAAAHMFRSQAYAQLKKYAQAIGDVSRAIELRPRDHHLLYLTRADLHRGNHDDCRAVEDLDTYLKLHPERSKAFVVRISKLLNWQQQDLAIVDLDREVAGPLASADALILRASLRDHDSEIDTIRSEFEKSLSLPLSPMLLVNRVYLAGSLDQWAQAVKDGEQAFSNGLQNQSFLANYARALNAVGRNDEALLIIEQALQRSKEAALLAVRALILHALGQHERALNDINQAIEGEPLRDFYGFRAKVYTSLGKDDLAAADTMTIETMDGATSVAEQQTSPAAKNS